MNERIKELAEQAGCNIDGMGYGEGNIEKFAELIVKECAGVARTHTLEKYPGMNNDYDGIVHVEEAIKQHFGVEE